MIKLRSLSLILAAIAAIAITPASTQVQNPGVQQDGSVTATHCASWTADNTIGDAGASCAGESPVQSVFGRVGTIVATANDYNFNQLAGSLACSQQPAFTGDVQSPAGACANTLATVNANVGSFGSATQCLSITANAKGLITAASASTCAPAFSSLSGSLAASQLPAFTGDVTSPSGSSVNTLATVNVNVGSFGSATNCVALTVNGKGLITAASASACTPPFSAVTGQATLSQLPTIAANTVLSNWTGSGATPLANVWPACANDGSHALVYISGTGLQCETIASGGTVTSAIIAGATGIGATGTCTITTTGTCTLAPTYGTTSNTIAQGNDSRITGAAQQTGVTTWTPADGSGAALTFASVSANYTKIGNMVFAYAALTYPVTVDASNAKISGLPVAIPASNYARQCSVSYSATTTGIFILPDASSSVLEIYANPMGTNMTNANMSGRAIYFNCVYPAS